MTSISVKTPYYSPWFLAKTEKFDFGQKGYHMKGHLKRNRILAVLSSAKASESSIWKRYRSDMVRLL